MNDEKKPDAELAPSELDNVVGGASIPSAATRVDAQKTILVPPSPPTVPAPGAPGQKGFDIPTQPT